MAKGKITFENSYKLGKILVEEAKIEVVNITEKVETGSVFQSPEPITPQRIELSLKTKPKTIYMNNDFQRFIETRRAKTVYDL